MPRPPDPFEPARLRSHKRKRRRGKPSRRRSIVEWSLAFALMMLTVLTALSVRVFVAPFALAALGRALTHRSWPEAALGALLGAGVTLLVIGGA